MLNVNKVNVAKANNARPAFKGNFGRTIMHNSAVKHFAGEMEYSNFTMSLTSMLILLYGATIVPRYLNARDKYDRREILTRDFLSITSILFGAKALNKVISRACAKGSGFVLNKFPKEGHNGEKWYKQAFNYIRPNNGVGVLKSKELEYHYSNLETFPERIKGWTDFITKEKGDVKKILSSNKQIKQLADAVVGSDIKTMENKDLINKLIEADKNSKPEMKNFYEALKDKKNPLVKQAKTMNSSFDFLSTICLVPGFMVWIESFNEKVTKRQKAADDAAAAQKKAVNNNTPAQVAVAEKDQSKAFANFAGNKKA